MKARACFSLLVIALLGNCSKPKPPDAPEPTHYNLLLVTIDTLRKDHLSCYGYQRATSPNLDRLASEGIVFDSASTPRAKTTPAIASLFTGEYPHGHGVRDLLQPIGPGQSLLPDRYRRNGYRTAAIVGNFVLQDRYCGFARAFDRYVETLPSKQGVPPDDVAQRTAKSMTQAGLVALALETAPALDEDEQAFEPKSALVDPEKPWFLWMHYMDPHGAYEPPQEHRIFHSNTSRWIDPKQPASSPERKTRISEYNVPASARGSDGRVDANAVVDLYDGEIHYVDAQLGRLVDALRARGDLARTWIYVTSDHGESLGEHDYWFEHGFYAYESTCAIPLIVRPPDDLKDRPSPGRRAGAISLSELFHLSQDRHVPSPFVHGEPRQTLLHKDDPQPHSTFSEKMEGAGKPGTVQIKAVRLGRYKLIRRFTSVADSKRRMKWLSEELYDLDADPLESRDLASSPPPVAPLDLLREELVRFATSDDLFELSSRADPEALRALKSLGY